MRRALTTVAVALLLGALASLVLPPPAGAQEATRRAKIYLLRHFQAYFHKPPQFVILGSSRSMRANPSEIGRKLHLDGINLGVGSGAVGDAYAFLRLTRARYPRARPGVLWFLDIEAMYKTGMSRYLRSVPDLTKYLSQADKGGEKSAAGALVAQARTLTAVRSLGSEGPHSYWYRNGYLAWCAFDYRRVHGQTAATRVRHQLRTYAHVYRNGGWPGISTFARRYATRLVKLANERKVTPVIVLTPYYPRLRAFIAGRGWLKARAQVVDFFRELGRTQHLRLIDMTSIKSFGGWPDGFFDGVHQRPALTRKLLRAVVARAGSLLRPAPNLPAL